MEQGFVSYSVENDRAFTNALRRARAAVQDLRVPLGLIAQDFYKSQKAIFSLQGPGQYPDLAQSTKDSLQRAGRSLYPMLVRSGKLRDAASVKGARGNVTAIYEQRSLLLGIAGSAVPYAIYHQSSQPRNKVPLRKILFIGPEARQFATSEQMGRVERWLNTLNAYVLKRLKSEGLEVGEI